MVWIKKNIVNKNTYLKDLLKTISLLFHKFFSFIFVPLRRGGEGLFDFNMLPIWHTRSLIIITALWIKLIWFRFIHKKTGCDKVFIRYTCICFRSYCCWTCKHVTMQISLTGRKTRKTISNTESKWNSEYVPVFHIYEKIIYITFT